MPRKSVRKTPADELDSGELTAKIMRGFCEGKTPTQIASECNVSRQRPQLVLKGEAQAGRLQYLAPLELVLGHQIERRWPALERARVVHSVLADDVSYRTAELLIELIQRHLASNPASLEIHLGFAGGRLLRETARILARLIESEPSLHRVRFHFHAVLAAFNARNPWNDPNAFFGYFADSPVIQAAFWGLPAPGLVTGEELEALKRIGGVQEAFSQADKLDIIVTSAGAHWDAKCSRLSKLYTDESFQQLTQHECLGDLMWRPLNAKGPVVADTAVRAMTLFEISKLTTLVHANKKVVLSLGLCGNCGKPKTDVLRAILDWKQPELRVLTHIVLDSLTARTILS